MAPIPLSWIKNLGRNGWDRPIEVGLDKTVEARNVYLYKGGLGTRRGGSVSVTITNASNLYAIFEYIPTTLAAAELWLITAAGQIVRAATSSTGTVETLADAVAQFPGVSSAVTLNKKLFLAYFSGGVNRLHVYDPNNATTDTVRRTGLRAFAAAPTAANTGAGAYPATLRYYRTRAIEQQSGITTRRSEPSASVSFTPSGAGTGVLLTRPTAVGENETAWEVEGSTDNITFYVVAGDAAAAIGGPIAIATTTYTDSSTPSTWGTTLTASAPSGTYVCFPAVKCLGTTGTRLYGFGVWESVTGDSVAPKNGRLYFTPALDTTTTNDDERISNTTTVQGFIDASRNAGAVDRGCAPKPVNNVIFCFQDRGVYAFYPTESNITPYRRVIVSTAVGNLAQQGIVVAVDHAGRATCFFLDPVLGPYMVGGYYGLAWVGKDIADIWATVNRDATTLAACGEWYPDRSQIIWLVATNGANSPNFAIVLDPSKMTYDSQAGDFRGGWTTYDGAWVNAYCIRAFSNTLAATRSSVRTPYTGTATKLLRYDETVNQDDTTPFQAYVTSGSQALGKESLTLQRAYTIATAQTGVQIQQSLIRNTGDEANRTSKIDLTPIGAETMVLRKFEDAALRDAWTAQVTLGDAAAQNVAWQIMQWRARMESGPEL